MGVLDNIDITLPDGTVNTVSELDDYIRATRSALKTFGLQEHDGDGFHQIPRVTNAEMLNLSNKINGRIVVNTTNGNMYQYVALTDSWNAIFTGAGAGDMLIATYDGDADGRVESADQITDGVNTVTAAQARAHIDSVANPHSVSSNQIDIDSDTGKDLDELFDSTFNLDIMPRKVFAKLALLHNRRMPV